MKIYNSSEAAARIRDLRKKRDFSQEELAKEVGVGRDYFGKVESDIRCCSIDVFVALSNIFDVSLDYLITGQKSNDQDQIVKGVDAAIERLIQYRQSL